MLPKSHRGRRAIPRRRWLRHSRRAQARNAPKALQQEDSHQRFQLGHTPLIPPGGEGGHQGPCGRGRRSQVRHGSGDDLRIGRKAGSTPGRGDGREPHQSSSHHGTAGLVQQRSQSRAEAQGSQAVWRAGGRNDGGLLRGYDGTLGLGGLSGDQTRERKTHHRPLHGTRRCPPRGQLPGPARPRRLPGRSFPRRDVVHVGSERGLEGE
mmetsp:Transcript_7293/g.18122  ORF Transcript_7293/g.18122 Transcript_7293/m.18122 type:complete len:208 (-) Transcript_7293:456-1079(-)